MPVDYDETPEGLRARIHAVGAPAPAGRRRGRGPRRRRSRRHREGRPARDGSSERSSRSPTRPACWSFAHGLVELGVELIATTGTAAYLSEHNLASTRVEDLTGVAEMLGGRVKTLHPSVHGALLARRDDASDKASLAEHGIEPIDLVDRQPLPVPRTSRPREESSEADIVEAIDIGGPAMVRAAAKNFSARRGARRPRALRLRARRAARVGGRRSAWTRAASWRPRRSRTRPATTSRSRTGSPTPRRSPSGILSELVKVTDLALRREPAPARRVLHRTRARAATCSRWSPSTAASSSRSTTCSTSTPRRRWRQEFTVPACVIVKHGNPCGVALAATPEEAYRKALAADPQSAFGGVVAVNRPLARELAELVAEQFVEVLHRAGLRRGRGRAAARAPQEPAPARDPTSAAGRRRASATPTACSAAC